MSYTVKITSSDRNESFYPCAGSNDQEVLIYARKVVEAKSDRNDLAALVTVMKDGKQIGPQTSVGEILKAA